MFILVEILQFRLAMPFNRLNHSILGEIRPRFALRIKSDPEETLNYLVKKGIESTSATVIRSRSLVFVRTPSWLQEYWSPEMTVRIEKDAYSDEVKVNCLIGPKQAVWAMFTLIYAFLILLTLFGGMFGLVHYQTDGSTFFLWCFPVGILAVSTVFFTAKYGQRKGRDQLVHLVSFVYHALEEITEVERV